MKENESIISDIYISKLKMISDKLESEEFYTHRSWEGNNLPETISTALGSVISIIDDCDLLDGGDECFDKIPYIYSNYHEVILLTLQGKRSEAFNLFKNNLYTTLSSFALDQYTKSKIQQNKVVDTYRVRCISSYMSNVTRKALFHVPFDQIHNIGNSRFSISGFPSLYLSTSTYGAWEELNRPDLKDCYFSRFQIDLNKLKMMDLSITPSEVAQEVKEYLKLADVAPYDDINNPYLRKARSTIISFLYAWPTILCSSYKVSQQAPFKVEYVFPQILLECLLSDEASIYDGIIFRSTKELALQNHLNADAKKRSINYVIPAKNYSESGYCIKTSEQIPLTEPINYALHQLISPHASTIGRDNVQPYDATVFGDIENILIQKKVGTIT